MTQRPRHDAALPAWSTAVDVVAVRALLDGLGAPPGPVGLQVRSYRPGRRGVVEVLAPGTRLFLKVLRPDRAQAVHLRHVLLRDGGMPVARSRGAGRDGLLLLEALPGTSLRARLRERTGPLPTAADLLALLDRLPAAVAALPRRRSWSDGAEHYGRAVGRLLPDETDRAARLASDVQRLLVDGPADAPTHGDLHDGQLLLDGGRISGLLDVDTAGPGRRADDLACLLGHLDVLAGLEPAHAPTTRAVLARWQAGFEQHVDPVDLRARVAGVVLSLATGPHRVQAAQWPQQTRDRLALAEGWVAAARRSQRSH